MCFFIIWLYFIHCFSCHIPPVAMLVVGDLGHRTKNTDESHAFFCSL